MNTQFFSSFTLNNITFTHFRHATHSFIHPEDFKRIDQNSILQLVCQEPLKYAQSTIFAQFREPEAQTEKIESTKLLQRFKKAEKFEKAEYQEEPDDIKTEPNHSEEHGMRVTKQEPRIKFEGVGYVSETISKSQVAFPDPKIITDKLPMITPMGSLNLSDYLKKELEMMISFILHNMGKVGQTEIENMRSHFYNNKCLLQIYDKLVIKYFSARRCREDIVRYILRRVFRDVRTSIMKEEKLTTKKANHAVCKKYFQKTFEELERSGREIDTEEELFELIMPYTKRSKNRTMNTTFVHEIFGSKKFSEDYQVFLGQFDEILAEDNDKKVEQLLEFLMDCIKKDTLDKIGNYKRLPWLDTWIQQTKDIALSLATYKKSQKHHFKKTKI